MTEDELQGRFTFWQKHADMAKLRQEIADDWCYFYDSYFYPAVHGRAFGPKPKWPSLSLVPENQVWRLREALRQMDSELCFGRWEGEDILLARFGDAWRRLFVRPSAKQPGMLAYTPTEAYGLADRQVITSVGKVLTKLFGGVISQLEIRDFGDMWRKAYGDGALLWAETADEVEHVYVNGPNSCMAGGGDWSSSEHPARLYGYCKDTKVAYLRRNGEITARAVVRFDVKPPRYYRTYGDCTLLKELLQEAGISYGSMEGLKLPAIEDRDSFLMPYIDGVCNGVLDGGYIRLSDSGRIYVQQTNGLSGEPETYLCHCDVEWDDEDDIVYSSYLGHTVCDSCIDGNYVTAWVSRYGRDYVYYDAALEGPNGDYYVVDHDILAAHNLVRVVDSDGDDVLISKYDAVYCEGDGEYHYVDDCVRIGDDWYLKDDTVEIDGESYVQVAGEWQLKANCRCVNGEWIINKTDELELEECLQEAA